MSRSITTLGKTFADGRVSRAAVLSTMLLLPLMACRDSTSLAPPRVVPAANAPSHMIVDPEKDPWDTFDADVNVSFYGQSAGTALPDPSRAVAYHVHRYQVNSVWRANYQFGNYRGDVPGYTDTNLPRVASANGAGGNATPSFYDANGSSITLEQPSDAHPSGTADYVPSASATGPQVPPPPSPSRMPTGGGVLANAAGNSAPSFAANADPQKGKRWVDRFVITPAAAKRIRESLTMAGAKAQARGRGVQRYGLARGRDLIEVDVDTTLGLVLEMRASVAGQLQAVTTREYEAQPFGHVLKAERIVRTLPDGHSRTMEITYSHVTLSKKEK